MRSRLRVLLCGILVASAALQSGCGTLENLQAPPGREPTEGPMKYCGPHTCFAFGGITRTYWGSDWLVRAGANSLDKIEVDHLLVGTGAITAGVGFLAVDGPLSLVGDVLTLPVAYARSQEQPWATWWGTQGYYLGRTPSSDRLNPVDVASFPPTATPTEP